MPYWKGAKMYTEVKCKKADVRDILKKTFPDYRGRTYVARFQDTITLSDTNWGGGTRNYYKFLHTDGRSVSLPNRAPWDNEFEGTTHEIPLDVMVVEHCIFCGHDLGIRIYLHTAHLPRWLPAG